MSPAGAAESFVRGLGRFFSAARLYQEDHPTRRRAVDRLRDAADRLLEEDGHATFSFLPGRVVHRDAPLRTLEDWPWAERLARAGVQRLEIMRGLRREELEAFLRDVAGRISDEPPVGDGDAEDAGEPEEGRAWRHVRYGTLGVETEDVSHENSVLMEEEAEAVAWIHGMAESRGRVPVAETLALVRSLSLAVRGAHEIVVPFVRLKETDQYTAAHCINVSILSMSLAESMDFPDDHVQALGAAGLLHDVGKADVPTEILNKPGKLDAEEWRIIEGHPVAGARILLESGGGLELPAVVAYEHHLGFEEGGYPDLHYERRTLPESRLVQVCDFYDALRTRRRYRKPLMAAEVVRILRRNEGKSLDPRFVEAMASLIERWDPSAVLAEIRPEDEAVDEDPDALEGADPASLP